MDILSILPSPPPIVHILDVGAAMGETDVYEALRAAGVAQVVGFEPQPQECAKLNAAYAAAGNRYLPHFIGDGTERTFFTTQDGYSSSLYEPNLELVSRFQQLGELYRITGRQQVQTRRLDDLPEIGEVDFVKIDTQGAELDVIRGGRQTISRAVLVQSEVEFVHMYKNQPLFAD